jgi:hypothetical protein
MLNESKEEFTKGIEKLRGITCPCTWGDFCDMAKEILPGYVFIGQREHHDEAHYGFYSFSVYAYTDESQTEMIGEDTFQAWLDLRPDGNDIITNIR